MAIVESAQWPRAVPRFSADPQLLDRACDAVAGRWQCPVPPAVSPYAPAEKWWRGVGREPPSDTPPCCPGCDPEGRSHPVSLSIRSRVAAVDQAAIVVDAGRRAPCPSPIDAPGCRGAATAGVPPCHNRWGAWARQTRGGTSRGQPHRRHAARRSPSTCRSHPCRWFQLTEMRRRQLTAQRAARRRSADACESPERTVPTHR
jgi:hypothetical protein